MLKSVLSQVLTTKKKTARMCLPVGSLISSYYGLKWLNSIQTKSTIGWGPRRKASVIEKRPTPGVLCACSFLESRPLGRSPFPADASILRALPTPIPRGCASLTDKIKLLKWNLIWAKMVGGLEQRQQQQQKKWPVGFLQEATGSAGTGTGTRTQTQPPCNFISARVLFRCSWQ